MTYSHIPKFQHKELAAGRWFELSLSEQMGNIGSEVERAIKWKNQGDERNFILAFHRMLELLYLTVEDKKNRGRLREIFRVREVLNDFLVGDNVHKSTDEAWQKYFLHFALAARKKIMERREAKRKS